MNPAKLDQIFRPLSEHEKLYQQNHSTPELPFSYVKKSGKLLMKSIFLQMLLDSSNPSSQLIVKQHSRFQDYPAHFHDWVELVYMYDGVSTQWINDNRYVLAKNQVLLIDSDTTHKIELLGGNDILINIFIHKDYINANFLKLLSSNSPIAAFFINSIAEGMEHNNFILFHSENSRRLNLFMLEFFCEWYDPSIHCSEMLNNLFTLVLTELVEIYEENLCQTGNKLHRNTVIPVLRYIESNYRTCNLASTAEHFAMNASYLSTQLKKRTGYSFTELLHQSKIYVAKQMLLNTDLSVTDIAHHVGYENISFFYKKFQKICGCLPGDRRKNGITTGNLVL